MSIRLVLVDDHAQFRAYLAGLLSQQPGLEVVAQAEGGSSLLRLLRGLAPQRGPDLVVMDVEMGDCSGIELTRRLRTDWPDLPVLALSMHDESGFALAMLQSGAQGYVLKGDPLAELMRAIRTVATGGRYLSPSLGGSGSAE